MFYAKSTGGFYSTEIHGNNMPSDVVEITYAYWQELLDGQTRGLFINSDENGYPILTEPPPRPSEELASDARIKRNFLLSASDWTQLPDIPQSVKDQWAAYRQALRDVPQQSEFPFVITWPQEP